MKRFLNKLGLGIIVFTCLLSFATASSAYAVDVIGTNCKHKNTAQNPDICPDASPNKNPLFGPDGIITAAVQILTIAVGIISVVVIILAGIRFITASGDPQSATVARNAIIYAIIGIVVVLISQALITFVLSRINV